MKDTRNQDNNEILSWRESIQVRRRTYNLLLGGVVFTITIAAIIVSINSTVFKQFDDHSLGKYNFIHPHDILKFAIDQLPNKKSSLEFESLDVGDFKDYKKVNYVFLIDVTGSLKNQTSSLKSKLVQELLNRQNGSINDVRGSEGLNALTSQSLIALTMIDIIQRKKSSKKNEISVGFIRGLDENEPISILKSKIGSINDSLIDSFLEQDQIEDRSLTHTFFDNIFNGQLFKNLLYPQLKTPYSENKTVLTIISDFKQDIRKNETLDQALLKVISSLEIHKNKVIGEEYDLQLNLLGIDLEEKNVSGLIKDVFYKDTFFYDYALENLDQTQIIEEFKKIISPTFYKQKESDHFLYSPTQTKKIPHRDNNETFERQFVFGKSENYEVTAIISHGLETRVKSIGREEILFDNNIKNNSAIFSSSDTVRIYQDKQLNPGFKFTKFDLYDKENAYRVRVHLWQAESMTAAGSFYYASSIIVAYTLLSIALITLAISGCKKLRTINKESSSSWNKINQSFMISTVLSFLIILIWSLSISGINHLNLYYILMVLLLVLIYLVIYDRMSVQDGFFFKNMRCFLLERKRGFQATSERNSE